MPVAGEIVERRGKGFRAADVCPFNDDGFTRVRGIVVEEFDRGSPTLTSIKRYVSWPSLGSKPPAEARAFADAIRAAADWAERVELEVVNADR